MLALLKRHSFSCLYFVHLFIYVYFMFSFLHFVMFHFKVLAIQWQKVFENLGDFLLRHRDFIGSTLVHSRIFLIMVYWWMYSEYLKQWYTLCSLWSMNGLWIKEYLLTIMAQWLTSYSVTTRVFKFVCQRHNIQFVMGYCLFVQET
jgi:hypothetical protein